MAITAEILRFVLLARSDGADFERTALFGRQQLHELDGRTFARIGSGFGYALTRSEADELVSEAGGYSEPLFHWLGAAEVSSIDRSGYEGATVQHDMNVPLPQTLRRRFSAVFDAGTLEHVFDAATAMRNLMEMIEPGGHLLMSVPANNWFGHGFFQFGPEFFYRTLNHANGFEIRRMLLNPWRFPDRWYEVADPALRRRRVQLVNSAPTMLYVSARRVGSAEALTTPPQQSDYEREWRAHDGRTEGDSADGPAIAPSRIGRIRRSAVRFIPAPVAVPRRLAVASQRHYQRHIGFYDGGGLRRVRPEELARASGSSLR